MKNELDMFLKRLEKDGFAIISDGNKARDYSRKRKIKQLREEDQLFIGNDRRKNVTIFLKKPFL